MILSITRITKALISLRGCAGWSAPLLSERPPPPPPPEDRCSGDEAHMKARVQCKGSDNFRSKILQIVTYNSCIILPQIFAKAASSLNSLQPRCRAQIYKYISYCYVNSQSLIKLHLSEKYKYRFYQMIKYGVILIIIEDTAATIFCFYFMFSSLTW